MRYVVPTAIVAGMVLGYFGRWWAIPLVAVAWSLVVVESGAARDLLSGLLVGAANALVGMLVALLVRRLTRTAGETNASGRDPDWR